MSNSIQKRLVRYVQGKNGTARIEANLHSVVVPKPSKINGGHPTYELGHEFAVSFEGSEPVILRAGKSNFKELMRNAEAIAIMYSDTLSITEDAESTLIKEGYEVLS